ncbi:hypothetical protein OG21DRAFT_1507626 [Imleria badia]|nr:hypothetical protein OG21DRAFT_1507626 [Imleria badia]
MFAILACEISCVCLMLLAWIMFLSCHAFEKWTAFHPLYAVSYLKCWMVTLFFGRMELSVLRIPPGLSLTLTASVNRSA